ncbi:MAG: LacI family DNA-binding transcriptional regulator [Spirochaetes bacterium]|nr:LacI family DNA-binding transcriptional regulator [Spirochaetota bacterium]
MIAKRITIHDVARESGQSASAVSRVIHHYPHILEEKKRKILDAIRKLNYRPGAMKRATAAILIDDFEVISSSGYESTLVSCLCRHFTEISMPFEIIPAADSGRLEESFIRAAVAVVSRSVSFECLRAFPGLPVLLLNQKASGFPTLASDHRESTRIAVEHLYRKGHRRIALIHSNHPSWGNRERISGYREALEDLGIPVDENLISRRYSPKEPDSLLEVLAPKPTALIAAGEEMGLSVYSFLYRLGKSVPKDYSVVSFEYPSISPLMIPPPTTISQNLDMLARQAVAKINRALVDEALPLETNLIPNTLIERESVREL